MKLFPCRCKTNTFSQNVQKYTALSSIDSYAIPFCFGSSMYSIYSLPLQLEVQPINKV